MRTFIIIGMLAMVTPAWAAQYCIDTNVKQEAALSWMVAERNAGITQQNTEKAKKTPPEPALPLETNDTYLQPRIKELLRDYVKRHQAVTVDDALKTDVEAATDAKKTKIRNVLICDKTACP